MNIFPEQRGVDPLFVYKRFLMITIILLDEAMEQRRQIDYSDVRSIATDYVLNMIDCYKNDAFLATCEEIELERRPLNLFSFQDRYDVLKRIFEETHEEIFSGSKDKVLLSDLIHDVLRQRIGREKFKRIDEVKRKKVKLFLEILFMKIEKCFKR